MNIGDSTLLLPIDLSEPHVRFDPGEFHGHPDAICDALQRLDLLVLRPDNDSHVVEKAQICRTEHVVEAGFRSARI